MPINIAAKISTCHTRRIASISPKVQVFIEVEVLAKNIL
jgi:hypothetical protein